MSDLRPNSSIADGVHWLGNRVVNNYIIEHDNELILIDTSMGRRAKGIYSYIKSELSDMKVAKIYITHWHVDHTGGMATLHHEFHPPIYVGKQDKPIIVGEEKARLPGNPLLKPVFYIARPFMTPRPVQEVELLEDGMISDNFTVYHLPGHTMGSMGFLKDKVMFSGDAAVTEKGKVAAGVNVFVESKQAAYSSLRKLAQLEFEMILPGHGIPILQDAKILVQDAVDKLDSNE